MKGLLVTLSINDTQRIRHSAGQICHYAKCHVLFIVIMNFIMLSVIMLDIVVLSDVSPFGICFYLVTFYEQLLHQNPFAKKLQTQILST